MKYFHLDEQAKEIIQDAIYDGIREFEKTYIGDQKMTQLILHIPNDIHQLARLWGWEDVEVKEAIVGFMQKQYPELKKKL